MIERAEKDGVRLPPVEIERQKNDVKHVVKYCQNVTDCRRSQVLAYFGEQFDSSACDKRCDNCANNDGAVLEDMSGPGVDALNLVKHIVSGRDRHTLLYAVDVFRGSQKQAIKSKGHNELPEAGKWGSLDRDQTDRLFNHLLLEEALIQNSVANVQGWHTTYLAVGHTLLLLTCLIANMDVLRWVPKLTTSFRVGGRS